MGIRAISPLAALATAALGGGFVGYSWCGGHLWHRQLVHGLLVVFVGTALMAPPALLAPTRRRLLFAASVGLIFLLARNGAAAFYPTTPESLDEFFVRGVEAFWEGPC